MALPQLKTTDIASAIAKADFVPEAQATGDEVFCTYKPYVGEYLVGRNQEDITGEEVIIIVDTLATGWILWNNGVCHERLNPFIEQLERKPDLPVDIAADCEAEGDDWNEARGVMFVTDDGLQCIWKGATMGIRKALDPIISEIISRASNADDNGYLYPKVALNVAEPYKSKKGGKIFNPLLDIVSWHDKDGVIQGEAKKSIEDRVAESAAEVDRLAETPKPRRRRKAA